MSSLAEMPFITVDDYLAGEEQSPVKHEYIAGEVFAMAGAEESHVTVALNLATMLRNHLRGGPCRAYISDMKLRVARADAYFYPDVFVTCDAADLAEPKAKSKAQVVIEVLSKSTEAFDRGDKFALYRQLDSLETYVLIDPRRPSIDVFRRQGEDWLLRSVPEGGRLELDAINFSCSMDQVYEDVIFEEPVPLGDASRDPH